jgi:uncharacterized membrane protein (UPF0136 family)
MPSSNVILWIYIVLLVVGGLIGFLKAKSKVSLYMSCGFAAALIVCAIPNFLDAGFRTNLANGLMAALLVVFGIRLAKTKKFMPAGLMLVATVVALALRNVKF